MKILITLVPRFDPYSGGVQMSTFKLSSFFNKMGHEVYVYSFENEGHVSPSFVKFKHALEKGLNYNPKNLEDCKLFIESSNPDIVINQMPYELGLGGMLKQVKQSVGFKLYGCLRGSFFAVKQNLETYRTTLLPKSIQPYFKNKLGYMVLLQIHKFNHARVLRKIMDTYDKYVLFGEANKIEMEYFIGKYKQDKLAYIPNSIPFVLEELPKKEKRLLWLSRVDYRQKHAELIIPLWKLLKDRLPDWTFDVVGDGGAFEDLKNQIREEKLERIVMHGKQVPDEYYKKSPIYIMTSSFEGFPNTLIEAQSFGAIPIVFDSYPMVREIVTNQNAILVETFNLDKMAYEIKQLISDNEKLQKMMEGSLQNASKYTIDKVGQKWLGLFNS